MRKNTVFAWGAFFKCTFQYSQWILLPLAGVQTVHIQLIFISGAIKNSESGPKQKCYSFT